MAGEEEGSWVTQSLARLMRTRLWADPIEREGAYILRARPLGEVLSSCGEKVSRETVPRVEPAGERQHGDLLNSEVSQRCNRRQRGSTTHPGVVNDRNVRCIWAVNDLECAAMYSAVGCRPWRWTQTHQRYAFQVAEACSTYQPGNGCGWGQLRRLRWVFPSVVLHKGDGVIRTAEAAGHS